jgi:hypothetical protein
VLVGLLSKPLHYCPACAGQIGLMLIIRIFLFCLLSAVVLWACGQRSCVVQAKRHVHSLCKLSTPHSHRIPSHADRDTIGWQLTGVKVYPFTSGNSAVICPAFVRGARTASLNEVRTTRSNHSGALKAQWVRMFRSCQDGLAQWVHCLLHFCSQSAPHRSDLGSPGPRRPSPDYSFVIFITRQPGSQP